MPGVTMTVAELAAHYGVARSTVWRWVKRGLLVVDRVGPRTGVRVSRAGVAGRGALGPLDPSPRRAVVVAAASTRQKD